MQQEQEIKTAKAIKPTGTVSEFNKVINRLSTGYRYKIIVSDSIKIKLFVAVSKCVFGSPVYFLQLKDNKVKLVTTTIFEQTHLNLESKFTKPTISALYYQPLKDWLTQKEASEKAKENV